MVREPSIPLDIVLILGVLTAVNLDNKPSLPANKIDGEGAYRLLTHEFEAAQLSCP